MKRSSSQAGRNIANHTIQMEGSDVDIEILFRPNEISLSCEDIEFSIMAIHDYSGPGGKANRTDIDPEPDMEPVAKAMERLVERLFEESEAFRAEIYEACERSLL